MNFFDEDEDLFEDLLKNFMGRGSSYDYENNQREIISGEADERKIGITESEGKVFLLFKIPGYNEKDIQVETIGGNIEISARKKETSQVQGYFLTKLSEGIFLRKQLPSFVDSKKFKYTFKNGILEVSFNKK